MKTVEHERKPSAYGADTVQAERKAQLLLRRLEEINTVSAELYAERKELCRQLRQTLGQIKMISHSAN